MGESKASPETLPPDAGAASESFNLPFYYPAEALGLMPEALTDFAPRLPPEMALPPEGKLTVRLWINQSGDLELVRIVSDSLPGAYSEIALAAFREMRFRPGEIDGAPVRAWVDIVIEYKDLRPPLPWDRSSDLVPVDLKEPQRRNGGGNSSSSP